MRRLFPQMRPTFIGLICRKIFELHGSFYLCIHGSCAGMYTLWNTLEHTGTHWNSTDSSCVNICVVGSNACNTLQHTAIHCHTPHQMATNCNTLQHIATHCNSTQLIACIYMCRWQQYLHHQQQQQQRQQVCKYTYIHMYMYMHMYI